MHTSALLQLLLEVGTVPRFLTMLFARNLTHTQIYASSPHGQHYGAVIFANAGEAKQILTAIIPLINPSVCPSMQQLIARKPSPSSNYNHLHFSFSVDNAHVRYIMSGTGVFPRTDN